MTSRERLMAIFRGDAPDRPAVKLWAAGLGGGGLLHPAYEPVRAVAAEKTDLVLGGGSAFDLCWGADKPPITTEERPTGFPLWVDHVTHVETPAGPLESVHRASTCKQPGYHMEYLVKEPDDLKKLLSVPYRPFPFDASSYRGTDEKLGDRGVTMFGLPHAMYGLQDMVGSENFALWSIEHRDEMLEVIDEYGRRILDHVKQALASGLGGAVFAWVGPELCIPPLMSPRDFDDFVTPADKAICDAVHEGGGYVWVHCHGKMCPVIERFIAMGVDVLNPIEPPPMGDMTIREAFDIVGERLGLEGGIENHDFWTKTPEVVAEKVREVLDTGRGGRRLIMCTASGYMEDPQPTERFIENLLVYVNEGVRYAESIAVAD